MPRRSFTAHRSVCLLPEVALGRLNRDVPEEELDLVQFAAGEVAQSSTGASQIVRPPLTDEIGDDPVLLALLNPPELQGQQLVPPEPTPEEPSCSTSTCRSRCDRWVSDQARTRRDPPQENPMLVHPVNVRRRPTTHVPDVRNDPRTRLQVGAQLLP